MTLEEWRSDADMCCRCSACKFVPLERVEHAAYSYGCPSVAKNKFHAYSAAGRLAVMTAMLEGRLEYSPRLLDVVHSCLLCGSCDVACKYAMDMEVLEPLRSLRAKCVEDGQRLGILDDLVAGLKTRGTLVGDERRRRGEWAEGLGATSITEDRAGVVYHAGCRTAFDEGAWNGARAFMRLVQGAGVDVAIAGSGEPCCGGRAFEMGYREEFLDQAKRTMTIYERSGAHTLVTGCADCYHAFKVLYDRFGVRGKGLKVVHAAEYLAGLVKEGRVVPAKSVGLKVTYQDPCHLGRLGEPYVHWEGKPVPGLIRVFEPTKEYRRGTFGVYQPPRDILRSIDGVELIEMPRTKEYAWCCGAGGGMREANPEFALWTAQQRIAEAEFVGAEAIVTACAGCRRLLEEAIQAGGANLRTYDIAELLEQAV
jgi:Fe-S oxidoreductase